MPGVAPAAEIADKSRFVPVERIVKKQSVRDNNSPLHLEDEIGIAPVGEDQRTGLTASGPDRDIEQRRGADANHRREFLPLELLHLPHVGDLVRVGGSFRSRPAEPQRRGRHQEHGRQSQLRP